MRGNVLHDVEFNIHSHATAIRVDSWVNRQPNKARRKFFKELYYLVAPELLSDDDLLLRVDGMNLENVLGDIQTDRGNLRVDGSLM